MAIRCVVLDFDGTFTDVDEEARPFVAAYRAFLADLVGADISAEWARHEADVAANPTKYGWLNDGKIVAPGNADPYIRASTVTQKIFDERGLLTSGEHRNPVMQTLYKQAYGHTHAAFKPEAKEVLDALGDTGLPICVVTNATPEVVKDKLDALGLKHRHALEVFGDAKKYVIAGLDGPDPIFDALPESIRVDGLDTRPIYLKRGMYYRVLRSIWTKHGIAPSEMLMAGDIWELDLSLPAALGFSVQLVSRAGTTPQHELDAVQKLGSKGGVAESLRAILARLS